MILITGCAGTLGKEFIRQLKDEDVIGIDNNEWAMAELQKEFPEVKLILDDFAEWKFDQDPCDTVIHTAAYKHVNLGEENPNSFIDNNIIKTRKFFAEAYKNGADIVFISTDKAVEPCSLYGFSKAIGESLARFYGGKVVRLGNLLNSSGSVIPVWEKCIAENKPLPVTDPQMTRYVIEVEDAVKQILENLNNHCDLFIPDMGQPIKLQGLVKNVLQKHNKMTSSYPIEIIGMRPGEKKHEKLRWEHEETI